MSNTPKRRDATATRKQARPRPRPTQDQGGGRQFDWKKWGLWGIGGIVAIGLIVLIIADQPESIDLPNNAEIPEAVETFEVSDRSHVETAVAYPQDPPVGGAHNPVWLNCGFYTDPVPNENAVHALEHGVVWITYQEGLGGDDLDTLRALANESEVIVSPYPGLDSPVVASAWGAQMRFDSAADPDLLNFVATLRNTLAPEAGASCLGGVGRPES